MHLNNRKKTFNLFICYNAQMFIKYHNIIFQIYQYEILSLCHITKIVELHKLIIIAL